MANGDSISIEVQEAKAAAKLEKVPMLAHQKNEKKGWKKGIAITDFVLRLGAIAAALGAAAAMGTSDETLPFFTQFFQFEASYDDLPTFMYVIIHSSFSFNLLLLNIVLLFYNRA